MNRTVSIAATVSLLMSAAACGEDTQGPTAEDLRVQDSLLNADVMAAWGDTFHVNVEEPTYSDFSDVKAGASGREVTVARTPERRPGPGPSPVLIAPSIAIVSPNASITGARPSAPRAESPRTTQPAARRAASIRNGSALSLVTNERVCTSRVGETFGATLIAPVATSAGTIPSGSRAVAEITSNDEWGAGIGVRIRSISTDGTSYPVSSRVTYLVPENKGGGVCIPRRAHIDTEVRS